MKRLLILWLLVAPVWAADIPITDTWDVELTGPQNHDIRIFRGETHYLQPRYLKDGAAADLSSVTNVTLWYKPSALATAAWMYATNGVVVSTNLGTVKVIWAPACEASYGQYDYNIDAGTSSGRSLSAAGKINLSGTVAGTSTNAPGMVVLVDIPGTILRFPTNGWTQGNILDSVNGGTTTYSRANTVVATATNVNYSDLIGQPSGSTALVTYVAGQTNTTYINATNDAYTAAKLLTNGVDTVASVDAKTNTCYINATNDAYVAAKLLTNDFDTVTSVNAKTNTCYVNATNDAYAAAKLLTNGAATVTYVDSATSTLAAATMPAFTNAWRLIYSGTSTTKVELALGAPSTYLKSAGLSSAPTWAAVTATATNVTIADLVGTMTNGYMLVGNGSYLILRDPAFVRTNLGVAVGVDVQAFNTNLLMFTTNLLGYILTIDGAGSGIDADKIDGLESADIFNYYLTNLFVGSGTTGLITSGAADAGKLLQADATWIDPFAAGSGLWLSNSMVTSTGRLAALESGSLDLTNALATTTNRVRSLESGVLNLTNDLATTTNRVRSLESGVLDLTNAVAFAVTTNAAGLLTEAGTTTVQTATAQQIATGRVAYAASAGTAATATNAEDFIAWTNTTAGLKAGSGATVSSTGVSIGPSATGGLCTRGVLLGPNSWNGGPTSADNVMLGAYATNGTPSGTGGNNTQVGNWSRNMGTNNTLVGMGNNVNGRYSVVVGQRADITADGAVQLGNGTNTTSDSVQHRNWSLFTNGVLTIAAMPTAIPTNGGDATFGILGLQEFDASGTAAVQAAMAPVIATNVAADSAKLGGVAATSYLTNNHDGAILTNLVVNGTQTNTGSLTVLGGGNVVTNGATDVVLTGTLTPTNALTVTNALQLDGVDASGYVTGGVFSVGTTPSNVLGTLYIPTNSFGGGGVGGSGDQTPLTNNVNAAGYSITNLLSCVSTAAVGQVAFKMPAGALLRFEIDGSNFVDITAHNINFLTIYSTSNNVSVETNQIPIR